MMYQRVQLLKPSLPSLFPQGQLLRHPRSGWGAVVLPGLCAPSRRVGLWQSWRSYLRQFGQVSGLLTRRLTRQQRHNSQPWVPNGVAGLGEEEEVLRKSAR